jgi:hypothetical protein
VAVTLRELWVVTVGAAQWSLQRSLAGLSVALLAPLTALRTLVPFEVLWMGRLPGSTAQRAWRCKLLPHLLANAVGVQTLECEIFRVVWEPTGAASRSLILHRVSLLRRVVFEVASMGARVWEAQLLVDGGQMVLRQVAAVAAHLHIHLALLIFRLRDLALERLEALGLLPYGEGRLQLGELRVLNHKALCGTYLVDRRLSRRHWRLFALEDGAHRCHLGLLEAGASRGLRRHQPRRLLAQGHRILRLFVERDESVRTFAGKLIEFHGFLHSVRQGLQGSRARMQELLEAFVA